MLLRGVFTFVDRSSQTLTNIHCSFEGDNPTLGLQGVVGKLSSVATRSAIAS